MDFFERQERARRHTAWLVLYFAAGVSMLILSIYLAISLVFAGASAQSRNRHRYLEAEPRASIRLWNPQLFSGVAIGTLAVIAMGSLFRTMELARGGSAVATMLGGRLVNPGTTDPDERKLLNVVEEMAIASGVPVPQVYVLPREPGINAFAAGHGTSDAAVAVTEGSLRLLNRDELQGVIAHEFSHLLNGDMRLNLRLMGIVFGILCVAVIGRTLLQIRGSSRDKNPLPLLGLILLVIGWIGVFFGRMIQAAVSRQREVLADASAVQFTRNPVGLASALKKIGGLSYGSQINSPRAEEASHMFFGDGTGGAMFHLMETHPPLVERIRALDPGFDGVFPRVAPEVREAAASRPAPGRPRPIPFPFPQPPRAAAGIASLAGTPSPILPGTFLTHAGAPTPAHLRYAETVRGAIPASLQEEARDPLGACALVYSLLLSAEPTVREKQLQELARETSPEVAAETRRLQPQMEPVAARARLPLVDLTLPALRQMAPAQFQQFRSAIQRLIEADDEIDLFEYMLQKIVLRHLEPHYVSGHRRVTQFYALKPLAPDCAVLLSALAYAGQQGDEAVGAAFARGAQQLTYAAQTQIELVPSTDCQLDRVDAALDRLSQAVPQIKKNVLTACAQVAAADGVIQEIEAELLRAIADALDCPMPPFIPAQ